MRRVKLARQWGAIDRMLQGMRELSEGRARDAGHRTLQRVAGAADARIDLAVVLELLGSLRQLEPTLEEMARRCERALEDHEESSS